MEARTRYGRDRNHKSSKGPKPSIHEDEAAAAHRSDRFGKMRWPRLRQARPPGRSRRRLYESACRMET
eukprot:812420-Pleurochrysis_carterae.AAC.1